MTYAHVHDPSYLEPDYDEDVPLLYPNPHGFGTATSFAAWKPFTITFLPAVTPLSEIPAALGGTKEPRPGAWVESRVKSYLPMLEDPGLSV